MPAVLVVVFVIGLLHFGTGASNRGRASRIVGHLSLATCVSAPCVAVGRWQISEPAPGVELNLPWQASATFVATRDGHSVRLAAPDELTCPTRAACVGLVTGPLPVVWTDDAGRHWDAIRVPGDSPSPSSISCYTARACVALATSNGPPILWWTTDRGGRWQVVNGPIQVAHVNQLDCVSVRRCLFDATSYLHPGATIAWSAGPAMPWHFVSLTREIDTFTQFVECISRTRCVSAYRTPSTGLVVKATSDGGRSWRSVASVSNREESTQDTTGADCTALGQCWIGLRTYASAQNDALFVDVRNDRRVLEEFPSGPFILPLGGTVCHGSSCFFFVKWHGTMHAAAVPLVPTGPAT